MAFEEHQLKDARAEAEAKFSSTEIEAARPLMDAYTFHLLDVLAKGAASSLKYYENRQKKIDKAMGEIEYDLGEDGEEPKLDGTA